MLYRSPIDDVVVYRSPVLDALDVPHGFGTRFGDDRAIAKALGIGDRAWVTVRQVHGHDVYIEDHAPAADDAELPRCDADAIVLHRPGAVARILTADCVPILLASTDGRSVAAVHAGWRGLVSGVIAEAVDALAKPFVAAIGPCIGVNRFEVGQEVAERFDPRFVRRDLGSRPHVDLRAATHAIVHDLGARQIDTSDRCTAHDEADFFSHRRDVTWRGAETTGRMASVIGPAGSV
jgi:hypothetical protein